MKDKSIELYNKTYHKLLKTKDKGKILKAAREKWQLTYREKKMRMAVDFSSETMKTRRNWYKNAERKETSTQNMMPSEDIL